VSSDERRWTFGVEPLPQALEIAERLRSVAGLVLSLEHPHPAVERLAAALRSAEMELAKLAPADPKPRIGPHAEADRRAYIDHARDVGAFNPCFPTYQIRVDGDRASARSRSRSSSRARRGSSTAASWPRSSTSSSSTTTATSASPARPPRSRSATGGRPRCSRRCASGGARRRRRQDHLDRAAARRR
jgi:hypothetical protein